MGQNYDTTCMCWCVLCELMNGCVNGVYAMLNVLRLFMCLVIST